LAHRLSQILFVAGENLPSQPVIFLREFHFLTLDKTYPSRKTGRGEDFFFGFLSGNHAQKSTCGANNRFLFVRRAKSEWLVPNEWRVSKYQIINLYSRNKKALMKRAFFVK